MGHELASIYDIFLVKLFERSFVYSETLLNITTPMRKKLLTVLCNMEVARKFVGAGCSHSFSHPLFQLNLIRPDGSMIGVRAPEPLNVSERSLIFDLWDYRIPFRVYNFH